MQPQDALKDLAEEATELRERLLADARALSLRDLIDPRKLESLKGANGIHNIAQDLQMLSQVLQENWPQIQGKSAAVAEDLQAASRIATRITRIVGVRAQSSPQQDAAIEQRERVFALTMRAYDETRAAIAFVRRREGDSESITPNLYAGKGRYRPPTKPSTDDSEAAGGTSDTAQEVSAVTPEAVAAAVAAQKDSSGSKGPFLS